MNFGEAIQALEEGKLVSRSGWNGKGLFVFMQVPATIGMDIVPKMQSLPPAVKEEFARRSESGDSNLQSICYYNQLALVSPNNMISGWSPSTSDALAIDWTLYEATL